jgi:probable FeS assembly SUF system protein SufT
MARIESEDADALGFEPEVLTFDTPPDGKISEEQVWQALRSVHDPEIPVNIVDLGLIYDVAVNDNHVDIEMTLTAPGCGMGPVLVEDVKRRLQRVPLVVDSNVTLVFDPPWSRDMMSEEAQLDLGLF